MLLGLPRLARLVALASVVTTSSGCFILPGYGDPEDSPPPVEGAIVQTGPRADWSLTVGGGPDKYVALADGATVEKVHGFQGGYHVWTSLLVEGDLPKYVGLELEVASATAVISRSSTVASGAHGPEGTTFANLYAYVDAGTTGPVVIRVTLYEMDGAKRWAKAEKSVVLR